MRAVDAGFATRVMQTSAGLALVGLFCLPGLSAAGALSLLAGLLCAWLVWRGAETVGSAFGRDSHPWPVYVRLGAVYLGKYGWAALALWLLDRRGLLDPVALTGGVTLPVLVAALKAIGRGLLPDHVDPLPFWARKAERS